MFSLSDTRFFKLTTHLNRTAHFFQTEGQVALIQRIDGYEPAQYPLLRCKGTAFYAIHQAFTHYFSKVFGFKHFASHGATLANLQNVRLSVYSVVSLPSLIFSILVFLNAAVCTLLYSIYTGEP